MNKKMRLYFIEVNGQQQGPYEEEVLKDYISQGHVHRNNLVWTAEMSDWVQIATLPEFSNFFPIVPPPIPKQSTDEVDPSLGLSSDCPLVNSVREAIENHLALMANYSENSIFTRFITKGHNQEIGIVYGDGFISFVLKFDKPELIRSEF